MKKKVFLTLILLGLIFFLKPQKILAGPQCTAAGGTCYTACNTSSTNLGNSDCPIQSNGRGGGIQTICCIYKPPAEQTQTGNTSTTTLNVHGKCRDNSIDTAIGCIPVLGGQEQFLGFILGWAIGIGGGIAFLLIVYAGFMIMTSSGNPERLKAGQELLTGAISGLVLLILSIFILNFIGVKILQIPGFGGSQETPTVGGKR